jgi:hypothetical protein
VEATFYREHWGLRGPKQLTELLNSGAFAELPIIRKPHIRDHWSDGVDMTDAVDVVSSSGTTGRSVDFVDRPRHRDRLHPAADVRHEQPGEEDDEVPVAKPERPRLPHSQPA